VGVVIASPPIIVITLFPTALDYIGSTISFQFRQSNSMAPLCRNILTLPDMLVESTEEFLVTFPDAPLVIEGPASSIFITDDDGKQGF
jgi:retron-type reverse transcriptase